jgi:hypothetical protein
VWDPGYVARDPLNFFSPFERLPANHENQLTRALLVLLNLSPMAHSIWLRLVAPARPLQTLPTATFATQRRAVRTAGDDAEPADLVSVFLAPEEPLSGGGVVTESDRGQVLDAVIDYGGELLVVVENKVAEADDYQARQLNITGARVQLPEGKEAVVVLWRDLLDEFIALREKRLVGGAEDGVLDQFLTYVEDHFAELGPFRTLRLCHGNAFRQYRRLRKILGDATNSEAVATPHGPYVATFANDSIGANAYLHLRNTEGIELALYPADTLTQARAFYENAQALNGLKSLLEQPGWHARPNFHFGHFQRGYCWTCNRTPLERYLAIWTEQIDQAALIPRDDWTGFWQWLESEQIACPEDWPEFERHFVNTQRSTASPRPGIKLSHRWSIEEAEEADGRAALTTDVREALNSALTLFGEPRLAQP